MVNSARNRQCVAPRGASRRQVQYAASRRRNEPAGPRRRRPLRRILSAQHQPAGAPGAYPEKATIGPVARLLVKPKIRLFGQTETGLSSRPAWAMPRPMQTAALPSATGSITYKYDIASASIYINAIYGHDVTQHEVTRYQLARGLFILSLATIIPEFVIPSTYKSLFQRLLVLSAVPTVQPARGFVPASGLPAGPGRRPRLKARAGPDRARPGRGDKRNMRETRIASGADLDGICTPGPGIRSEFRRRFRVGIPPADPGRNSAGGSDPPADPSRNTACDSGSEFRRKRLQCRVETAVPGLERPLPPGPRAVALRVGCACSPVGAWHAVTNGTRKAVGLRVCPSLRARRRVGAAAAMNATCVMKDTEPEKP